ncbi:MAG: multidrug effflux MFS transporter [Steroidobacteraceae bacterium]
MTAQRAVPTGLAMLLALMSILSPFSIDTFFPALRNMQVEFGVDALQIQQAVTAYMLPYAIFSLLHGPLSDALGRRPVVLAGMGLYALASLACALAPGYGALLAFRATQGITAGAGMAVGRAVVRDLYDGPEAQRLANRVTMFFALAPAIAPIVGGWLFVAFGWRSIFVFLALLGAAVCTATWRMLPETLPPERRLPIHPLVLATQSWRVASHGEFLLLAIAGGLSFCSMITYVGAAPAIVLDHWGLGPTDFAALFVPGIGGMLLGAFLSSRMAGRLSPARQLRIGYAASVAAGLLAALLDVLLPHPPMVLQQALFAACSISVQLVTPVLMLRMLDLFPQARGSAASVQSFLSLLLSSSFMGVIAPLVSHSMFGIALASLCASILSAGGTLLAARLARAHAAAQAQPPTPAAS